MGKPVLVLRNVTERPEGVEAGTLKLAGTDTDTVYTMAKELLENKEEYMKMAVAKNPVRRRKCLRKNCKRYFIQFW